MNLVYRGRGGCLYAHAYPEVTLPCHYSGYIVTSYDPHKMRVPGDIISNSYASVPIVYLVLMCQWPQDSPQKLTINTFLEALTNGFSSFHRAKKSAF